VVLWGLPSSRAGDATGVRDDADAEAEVTPDAATLTAPRTVRSALRPIAAPLLALNVLGVAGSFVAGGLGVLTVVLAVDILRSGEAGTGLLNAAVGAGGLIGALISGALVLRRRLAPPLILGGIAFAASVLLLGQTGSLGLAMVALAVGSAGALLVEV
ncbi:MAG: hypothetical protein M3395_04175, partial [Chloroflexota bacterium]|nr:hypothetical protein [Chloroflexota bacterium]